MAARYFSLWWSLQRITKIHNAYSFTPLRNNISFFPVATLKL